MSGEVATLAAEVVPYASAAAAAYGGAVLSKVRDDAADATVGLVWSCCSEFSVPAKMISRRPSRSRMWSLIRLMRTRRRLCGWRCARRWPPTLGCLDEVRDMLAQAGVSITASGERSIAAQEISGVAVTGDDATITR